MKIISGKYKNRVIPLNKKADYRPTTSKFREALFSILFSGEFADEQPIIGANILDIFSGSGILSFESLSRGAKSATLIDKNNEYLLQAKRFADKIGEAENLHTICVDALRIKQSHMRYDVIFLDPPYYQKFGDKILPLLIKYDWINDNGLVAIEMDKRENLEKQQELASQGLELIREKIYGKNKLLIYRYKHK